MDGIRWFMRVRGLGQEFRVVGSVILLLSDHTKGDEDCTLNTLRTWWVFWTWRYLVTIIWLDLSPIHLVEAVILSDGFTQFLLSDTSWSTSHGLALQLWAFLYWAWANNKTSSSFSSFWRVFDGASILASSINTSWLGLHIGGLQSSKSDIGVQDGPIRVTGPTSLFCHCASRIASYVCGLIISRIRIGRDSNPSWEAVISIFGNWTAVVSVSTRAWMAPMEVEPDRSWSLEKRW